MLKHYQRVMQGMYENHVLPFLWQKGETHKVISSYLKEIAAAGIHEVCLESRPHPDFCGDGWWEDLSFIISVCKRLGLKIWLLDDSHFPTGYANGWIEKIHPELRKTVLMERTFDVVGPTPQMSIALSNPFDEEERFLGAIAIKGGVSIPVEFCLREGNQTVNRSDLISRDANEWPSDLGGAANGRSLVFDVPDGSVRICVLFTSRHSGFRDNYINMVDSDSCDALIDAIYQPHFNHFKHEFGKTILGFFSDEPGFMNEKGTSSFLATADSLIGKPNMPLPWSAELESRLRRKSGSNYLYHLSQLWSRDASGACARHLYMDEATDLYRACFAEKLSKWCRLHKVEHIGHVIEDKGAHVRLGIGAGHFFRALAGQSMAGVDIVINQLVPGMDQGMHSYGRGAWDLEFFNYALAKLGSSAAHIDPVKQGRCLAEVFGAFGWHEGLKEMKWIVDHFLVRGVNWFVPHAFSQAPFPDPDCPPHFFAHGNNPQFRYFPLLITYMNQMGTLLSDGVPHLTAAVLYHADAVWAGQAMPEQRIARKLIRNQIDFDIVPAEAFTDETRYECSLSERARSFTVNGQGYRCLIIPHSDYIGSGVLYFIQRLRDAGIPVLIVEDLPQGLYDGSEAERNGFAACDRSVFEKIERTTLESLVGEMLQRGLFELKLSERNPWLRAYHYSKQHYGEEEDYWFFVNEHPKHALEVYVDDLNGTRLDLLQGSHQLFDGTLKLEPYESCLVVRDRQSLESKIDIGSIAPQASSKPIEGPWSLSYATPYSYPEFGDSQVIQTFEEPLRSGYYERTGTFRYGCALNLRTDVRSAVLDLGELYETAEVFIDSISIGVRICPPYSYEIGQLAAGNHDLTIEVTNTIDHEVVDMFSLTEVSEPSGLLGPVNLKMRKL